MPVDDLVKTLEKFLASTNEQAIRNAAIETVPILAMDLETEIIVFVDPLVEAMFGYEPGELKGKTIHELVPDRLAASHKVHVEMFRANPMRRTMGTRGMEIIGKRKDGSEFPVSIGLSTTDIWDAPSSNWRKIAVATLIDLSRRMATGTH